MRIAFRVAYIGTRFSGSQLQPEARTVEGVIIDAACRLGLFLDFREARFLSAGRTDAGVSAAGQVIAFSTPYPKRAVTTLNRMLPPDCWCTGWAVVHPDFHPRHHATSRTYRYSFPSEGLDCSAMADAASWFVGEHDFTRLSRLEAGRNPVRRIISASVFSEDDALIFEVKGESFLWNMVRGMATLLQAAGTGLIQPDQIRSILAEEGSRIPAAPAAPLVLYDVDFALDFHQMEPSEKTRSWLALEEERIIAEKKVLGWLCRDSLDIPRKKHTYNKLGHLL